MPESVRARFVPLVPPLGNGTAGQAGNEYPNPGTGSGTAGGTTSLKALAIGVLDRDKRRDKERDRLTNAAPDLVPPPSRSRTARGTRLEAAKNPGPWLLIQLWACGATVAPGPDSALVITPHVSGKRIPAVLIAAAHRHHAALASWVGADPILPMRWMRVMEVSYEQW